MKGLGVDLLLGSLLVDWLIKRVRYDSGFSRNNFANLRRILNSNLEIV